MATPVILPKQGQSVETCLLIEWKKNVGDSVSEGDALCEVETDKASFEVEAPVSGTLLAHFFDIDSDIEVLTNIAAIGEPGEDVDALRPDAGGAETPAEAEAPAEPEPEPAGVPASTPAAAPTGDAVTAEGRLKASPRARQLADQKGVALAGLSGSGPQGRIIERDVAAAAAAGPQLTPAAAAALAQGGQAPAQGSGIGGRVVAADIGAAAVAAVPAGADEITEIPVKGIRKLISDRMLESLQTTAQLTLSSWAPATSLLALRKKFKNSPETMGLNRVTVNDILLYAVSRVLGESPELNCQFANQTIYQHQAVHLAFAVDTPRGLMVPVIRHADQLSLKALSAEAKRLAVACLDGAISPDELNGGTFTVSNLGNFGIETFTPVLNPPQVGILGVGAAALRPVESGGEVTFEKQLSLSLTINHQVVDGAPAARFLQRMSAALNDIDLLLAR